MRYGQTIVRTQKLATTQALFERLFDAVAGIPPSPDLTPDLGGAGCWLYVNGNPFVNLIEDSAPPIDQDGKSVDHAVLHSPIEYADFRGRLDTLGIHYSLVEMGAASQRRVLFLLPGGPLVEVVFVE